MKNENIAGIILAGGGSKRLGRPKQLLDWFGKSFINQVIKVAINVNLNPVIVVTGACYQEVEKNIENKNVIITRNLNWQSGQSSSIIKGIIALSSKSQAFLFLLCDQPQVPEELITEIMKKSSSEDAEIVTTRVGNKTCPPILFKPNCISELLALEGDKGGKELIDKFKTATVDWEDRRILLDSDTNDDYRKLIKAYENK